MKIPSAFIIEDDQKLATIFYKAFQLAEFDVEIARDGQIALERLAAKVPNLVVLDLHLPYVSGADILDHIRSDERLAQCRVVIVTADLFRAESLRNKADLVLIKPISFNELRDLARRLRTTHNSEGR